MCDDIMIFMIQVLQATFQSGVSPSQKACGRAHGIMIQFFMLSSH